MDGDSSDNSPEDTINPVPLDQYGHGHDLILHGNSHLTGPNMIVIHVDSTKGPTCVMHGDGKISWGDNTQHSINIDTLEEKLIKLFGVNMAQQIKAAVLEELEADLKKIVCPKNIEDEI